MQKVRKFEIPFREILESSLELVEYRKLKALFYIGYLANPSQVDTLLELIPRYRESLSHIILDPISGDHGRAYISESTWERIPELIQMADISFPNLTEIKLMTGNKPDGNESSEGYINQYKSKFGSKPFVLTSLPNEVNQIGFSYFDGKETHFYYHPKLDRNYGGTGDAFLAYFILYHYYQSMGILEALQKSADKTHEIMKITIDRGLDDLYL